MEFRLRTEYITLGQLLKAAGLAGTGTEAKDILAAGGITINGEPDNRRGRKLRPDDVVTLSDGAEIRIVA